MSVPAPRRKAAEGVEFEGCMLHIALNWPTDPPSRHAGPRPGPSTQRGLGFAEHT